MDVFVVVRAGTAQLSLDGGGACMMARQRVVTTTAGRVPLSFDRRVCCFLVVLYKVGGR